jgi:hypothetical protein
MKDLLATLRFGMAYSIQDLDVSSDPDHDHTLFALKCLNRNEAEIVMDIVKYNLHDFITYNSRVHGEYVDSESLADVLKVCEYNEESYIAHAKMAEQLLKYMVEHIKRVWPSKYSKTQCVMHFALREYESLSYEFLHTLDDWSRIGVDMGYLFDEEV